MAHKAADDLKRGKGIKILSPKILQRLQIALAQVKAGTFENLLN